MSIFNSKNFSGGYTPGPSLKEKGVEGRREEGREEGGSCVMAIAEMDAPGTYGTPKETMLRCVIFRKVLTHE